MKDRRIEVFWRKPYELQAALFWFIGAFVALLYGINGDFGFRFLLLVSIPLACMGVVRLVQANDLLRLKSRTIALPDLKVTIDDVIKMQRKYPDKVYVGHGFEWTQEEVQKAYDYSSRKKELFHPGEWYMSLCRFLGFTSKYATDSTYLHALSLHEKPLFMTEESRYSHRAISGASGSGKGTMVALDLICAMVRGTQKNKVGGGSACIMIDPKFDTRLLNLCYYVMKLIKREHHFFLFDPSHASSSCRLDLLSSYNNLAQVATRIVNIMPPSNDETFKKFAFRAVFAICQGITLMNKKITLVLVKHYIQQDLSFLIKDVGVHYFEQFTETRDIAAQIQGTTDLNKAADDVVANYYSLLHDQNPSKELLSLFGLYNQDQRHYQKLIQSIIPDLTLLTQSVYASLLSPSALDDDPRPIVTLDMIARGKAFLYISSTALMDSQVSTSLTTLLLNATAQLVGDRYFYPDESVEPAPLNIFIDEASEVVSYSTIQLLNKSRGSKTSVTLLYQGISDLRDRLNSQEGAEMILANTANKTMMRSIDETTMNYMSQQSGMTTVATMDYSLNTQSTTNQEIDFTTSYGKSLRHVEAPRISPTSIGDLPNLHFFMSYESSKIVKGRIPYLDVPPGEAFTMPKYGPTIFGDLPTFESLAQTKSFGAKYSNV